MKEMMAGVIRLSVIVFLVLLLNQCGKKKESNISNIVDNDRVYSCQEIELDCNNAIEQGE